MPCKGKPKLETSSLMVWEREPGMSISTLILTSYMTLNHHLTSLFPTCKCRLGLQQFSNMRTVQHQQESLLETGRLVPSLRISN